MGERKKKDRRREPPKKTEDLSRLPPPSSAALSDRQRDFCKQIIQDLLDDDSALSFSKPVDKLWDRSVLGDYFDKIKQPMDLGTVLTRTSDPMHYGSPGTGLFDANAFRYQARLVFLNAIQYNNKGTDLARFAAKFLHFVDTKIAKMPSDEQTTHSPQDDNADDRDADPNETQNRSSVSSPSNPSKSIAADKTTPKSKQQDQSPNTKQPPAEDGNGALVKSENHDSDVVVQDSETDDFTAQINALQKKKAMSEAVLAERELMRNVPLSFEENTKLRDEVESLPWEKAQKVAQILEKYVQDALQESNEEDPEFVTLEFSTVEPRLLRDIEALVRPDTISEKERKNIAEYDEEIVSAKRKLRSLDQGSKKKPRRRR